MAGNQKTSTIPSPPGAETAAAEKAAAEKAAAEKAAAEKAAADKEEGLVKLAYVRTVYSHSLHCHTQDILIKPHDFVRVELDSWVKAQLAAGTVQLQE